MRQNPVKSETLLRVRDGNRYKHSTMTATPQSKETNATIANKAPSATTFHVLTNPKNSYINEDVTGTKDSATLSAIVIYATESKVTSHVVNIYEQSQN